MTISTQSTRIRFIYPALPEIKLCYAIVFGSICYGLYGVLLASRNYTWSIGDHGIVNHLPFYGPAIKDQSSWEWLNWSPFAVRYLPVLFLHTLIFNLGSKLISETPFVFIYTILSMAACVYYFTPILVSISIAQGTIMFIACTFFKRKVVVWISSLPLLYYIMHETSKVADNPFLIFTFVSYSMLSYVSYCMDTINGPIRKQDHTLWRRYLRMMFYTFYQPYLYSLIVLYKDFERQITERNTRQRDWRQNLFFALRIAFWWILLDVSLHFFYYEAIMKNIQYASTLPKDQFFALGLTLGIFFHLKYVVIFGLPSVFARFDNMDPLKGPICLNRVMLFSKVWREFDRGLYQFFKTYIFVPICQPTFSLPRKIFGVLVSYSFVLLWHGFYHHNIVWIILNIISLMLEMSAKSIYAIESFRIWREKTFSDVTFRRILAALHILPFAFGLYSNIYFLGGSDVGALFVKRFYEEDTVTLRWPLFLLLTLGYFYSEVCIEVDRRMDSQAISSKEKHDSKRQK
ncbi:MBOAT family protein [Dictyocaulus viviparus]|uniref:MBOAT family protein n=1 Tax=Dictyocaulus viviparus TaxID=29172 RepID=A0A0D8XRG4_DICVI|nr:MBOAT family protein [Dictyocaulus viviparus]